MTSTVALVESATQLLNVVEWAHHAPPDDDLRIVVCHPTDAQTVRQLRHVSSLARTAGLTVEDVDVRRATGGALVDAGRLAGRVASAERLVLGDPFSGLSQLLLPLARAADDVVIVDDGTATWEFADCIDQRRPLVRWRFAGARPSSRAARATKLLTPSARRRLEMFTCLAGATPRGAKHVDNAYAWTRRRSTPTPVAGASDVLGVSLVEGGVIDGRAYIEAVLRLAATYGPLRYVAHRRESDEKLALIAAIRDVRVVRSDRPVELAMREGSVAGRVITFPSTAAHTLPRVLAGTGVDLRVRPVEEHWFTPAATPHAKGFVRRIAGDAPLTQALIVA